MKATRIFIIVVIAGFSFVACEKSDIKPACGNSAASSSQPDNSAPNSRVRSTAADVTDENQIVGGGDDDREGGDKKKAGGR